MDSWEQSNQSAISILQRPESPTPQTGHNAFDDPLVQYTFQSADNSHIQGMQP